MNNKLKIEMNGRDKVLTMSKIFRLYKAKGKDVSIHTGIEYISSNKLFTIKIIDKLTNEVLFKQNGYHRKTLLDNVIHSLIEQGT